MPKINPSKTKKNSQKCSNTEFKKHNPRIDKFFFESNVAFKESKKSRYCYTLAPRCCCVSRKQPETDTGNKIPGDSQEILRG